MWRLDRGGGGELRSAKRSILQGHLEEEEYGKVEAKPAEDVES
jgi:hypothetical protein